MMASNTTSRFRSSAANLGAVLLKRLELQHNSKRACEDEENAFYECETQP
jgi:hypothetical protein